MKKRFFFKKFHLILLLVIVAFVAVSIWAFPFFASLKDEQVRQDFIQMIESHKAVGVLILISLQALQVIITVIPAGIVQVIAGAVYGVWGGLLIAMSGVFLGSIIVFIMVRKLGFNFAEKMISKNKSQRFSFLQQEQKRDTIIFLLFFIPGAPKDIITYLVPLTTMTLARFLLLSTVARVPGVLSGVWIGVKMGQGMWFRSLAIFAICALVGLVGLIYKDRLIESLKRHSNNKPNSK